MRRVLVVVTSDQRRGAELQGVDLARRLNGAGLEATCVALEPGRSTATVGVEVLGDRALGLRTLRRLRQRARAVDVVVAYGSRTLPACALGLLGSRARFVYRSIGDPAAWAGGPLKRLRTAFLLRRARRVVALWPGGAEAICRLYGLHPSTVDWIADPVPATQEQGDRSVARAAFGLPEDAVAVAVVGALSEEKRVDLALEAIALVDGASALVVGDGPRREAIRALGISRLGDRCVLTGALDGIADVLAAADVLLLTSRTEGLPGVILQAHAARVPVVAPAVGAIPWLVEQGIEAAVFARDDPPTVIAGLVATAAAEPRRVATLGAALATDAIDDAWILALSDASR